MTSNNNENTLTLKPGDLVTIKTAIAGCVIEVNGEHLGTLKTLDLHASPEETVITYSRYLLEEERAAGEMPPLRNFKIVANHPKGLLPND